MYCIYQCTKRIAFRNQNKTTKRIAFTLVQNILRLEIKNVLYRTSVIMSGVYIIVLSTALCTIYYSSNVLRL